MDIPCSSDDPPAGDPTSGYLPPAVRLAGGTELSWCRAVPGGTGITVLALLLSRPPSLPLLRASLRQLQLSHPILRSLLPSGGQSPAILLPPTPSDRLELISSPLTFPLIVERELNRNPWAHHPAPSFFASVYEMRESDRWVVALRAHTGACDRSSGVAILNELMGFMRGGEVEGEGEVGLAIEDLIRREDGYKPFWTRGRDLIGYSLNGMRAAGLGFVDVGLGRRSEFVRMVVEEEGTMRLLDVSRMI